MVKELPFFIIADFEIGNTKEPIILYEDGAVEIPSVLPRKKHRYGKQYYDCIARNLPRLHYRKRDLRKKFRPSERPLYLFEVLERARNQKEVSLARLWKFFYKDEIERVIDAASKAIVNKRIRRLIGTAFRKKPMDKEFLRRMGYIR